jgi:hypothetical protein
MTSTWGAGRASPGGQDPDGEGGELDDPALAREWEDGDRRLLVPAAYLERGAEPGAVAAALAADLRRMAAWLGLDAVAVGRRGDFVRPLAAAVRA